MNFLSFNVKWDRIYFQKQIQVSLLTNKNYWVKQQHTSNYINWSLLALDFLSVKLTQFVVLEFLHWSLAKILVEGKESSSLCIWESSEPKHLQTCIPRNCTGSVTLSWALQSCCTIKAQSRAAWFEPSPERNSLKHPETMCLCPERGKGQLWHPQSPFVPTQELLRGFQLSWPLWEPGCVLGSVPSTTDTHTNKTSDFQSPTPK